MDITISERELHTITGFVRGRRDMQPVARASVTLVSKDDETGQGAAADFAPREVAHNDTTTDDEGRWQFKEIPDGHYTISVKPREEYESSSFDSMYANMNVTVTNANVTVTNANVTVSTNMNRGVYTPPRRKRGYAPARRDVDVSGNDVSEVAVELADGGQISGTITVEGGTPQYGQVTALRVPEGAGEPGAEVVENVSARSGGGFAIEGLPAGKFFLKPSIYGEDMKAVYVKSITWNGRDLLRAPLEVGDGDTVEGVQIVFARDPAKLSVRAIRAGGKTPALNVNVFLVPANFVGWSPYSQQLFCSTGDDGECAISAPPGDYVVVALPRLKAASSVEAEVRKHAATAPRVSLRAGETKNFEAVVPGDN